MSNAVKYTQSGHIRVQTRRIDRQLLFVVSDTGPGIPGEATARIFEPFEQLEDVSHKHIPGIGLGLALVREMADALGGRVEVQSQLGVGSTFTLVLPIDGPSLAHTPHVQRGNEPDR